MDADDAIVEDLRRRIAASPFHAGFGVSVEQARSGEVRLGWNARPEHRNLQGLVHGGVLATLVDIAMGLAVRSVVGPARRHVTIELTVHYLRPTVPGRIEAVGTVLRVGSQIGFAEGSVIDDADRILVRASGTYSVTGERGPGAPTTTD
jgi:acyl-CoA thioesterase